MKSNSFIFIIFIFSLMVISSCTSDSSGVLQTISYGVVDSSNAIFGSQTGFEEEGIAKALLFIILFVFLYAACEKIPLFQDESKKASRIILAIVVALFGIRYLTPDLMMGILLPYGALSIAISVIVPFILYFYFVNEATPEGQFGSVIRRLCWLFFSVVMLVLGTSRISTIGTDMANIYFVFAVAALLLLIFDGTIHKMGVYFKYGKEKYASVEEQLGLLKDKRERLVSSLSTKKSDSERDKVKKQISEVDKNIKEMQGLMFS